MKGTPERPFCGFSRTVVTILQSMHVPFSSCDVLLDPGFRDAIKELSQWPTFPQLYVKEELVGGCDIVQELYTNGSLRSLLKPFIPLQGSAA